MPHRFPGWLLGCVLALVLGPSTPAWAGAWTVPRNRWYIEYFYRYFGSKHVFDSEGSSNRRAKTGNFRDIRNEWKLEYGVLDWFNLLASAPYISSHYKDDGTDLLRTGVGDIYVRTKIRLLNKPLLADEEPLTGSLQFSWKIPSAYDPIENPIGDGQVDFESRLMLGQAWLYAPEEVWVKRPKPSRAMPPRDRAIQQAMMEAELRLHAQRRGSSQRGMLAALMPSAEAAVMDDAGGRLAAAPAAPAPDESILESETRYNKVAFISLEGAFNARNEDPANEFPLVVEAGFTPFNKLMLVGSLDSVVSVNSTHEDIENFSKWGVRAILNVWGEGFASVFRTGEATVNVEVGYNDIYAGHNTADAFEVFGKVGVFF